MAKTLKSLVVLATVAMFAPGCASEKAAPKKAAVTTTKLERLSKPGFIEAADEICAEFDVESDALSDELLSDLTSAPSDEDVIALIEKMLPLQASMVAEIEALVPPAEDQEDVDEILEALRGVIEFLAEEAEENPSELISSMYDGDDPFADVDELAQEYGFDVCGADSDASEGDSDTSNSDEDLGDAPEAIVESTGDLGLDAFIAAANEICVASNDAIGEAAFDNLGASTEDTTPEQLAAFIADFGPIVEEMISDIAMLEIPAGYEEAIGEMLTAFLEANSEVADLAVADSEGLLNAEVDPFAEAYTLADALGLIECGNASG